MVEPKTISIDNNEILEGINPDTIEAFMFAEGGAMGRPGELKYFCIEDSELVLYKGNRYTKGIDQNMVNGIFTTLHDKMAWFHINLGMGNHLCMRPEYQSEFGTVRSGTDKHIYKAYEEIILKVLDNRIASKQKEKTEMKIGAGKIDFLQMPREIKDRIHCIASGQWDYQKHVGDAEKTLFLAYISFLFSQITVEEYGRAWAEFISFLKITPKDKGIRWLKKEINESMKNIVYESLWSARKIDPKPYIEMMFYQELYKMLLRVLEEKHIIHSDMMSKECLWRDNSVLYVYKSQTSCHTRHHQMESATAIFTGRNNIDIKLNVEYCRDCNKFYISYSVYERYREKYGMLLGKIKMDSASTIGLQDVVLSEFSPLKLCGYSVNQQDGYSKIERQYIISKVIEKGILKKSEVVRYLEYFINRNGQKSNNAIALEKWNEDLDFTLKFKMSEQEEYQIKCIKKY